MKLLVDGIEVPFKDNIELIEENCIVGCHCNGGTHTEVMGDYRIYIDKDSINIDITCDDEIMGSCKMDISDLFTEMDKTILVMENRDEIHRISNLFA